MPSLLKADKLIEINPGSRRVLFSFIVGHNNPQNFENV